MNRYLIPSTAAICLTMSAVLAADPGTLAPNRYGLAHKIGPPAVSAHHTAASLVASAASDAESFNGHVVHWRSFDVPAGVCGTQPAAINDRREITGIYFDATCNNTHGFLRKADGTTVTFDAPNVGYPATNFPGTAPTDINNRGDIVGYYTDANGGVHGFVRWRSGNFTIIDDPGSTSSPPATITQAINDWGTVVGFSYDSNGNSHGFVHDVGGAFIPFEPAGAVASQGYHINNLGEVGGDWSDATGITHGMLRRLEGNLVTFDAPDALTTFGGLGQALSLEGKFVGTYVDANLGAHGYVRHAGGRFTSFTAPGGGNTNFNGTWGYSINLFGTVVGLSYQADGTTTDGYVRFADGKLIITDAPVQGQLSTGSLAINDLNEFTGFWYDAQGNEHGFVALAIPPDE